jgi:hypothetical protein
MKERRKMAKGGLVAWMENANVCREIDRKPDVQCQRNVIFNEIEGNGTYLAYSRHPNSLPETPPRLHPDVHPGGQGEAYERADEDEGDSRVRELVV